MIVSIINKYTFQAMLAATFPAAFDVPAAMRPQLVLSESVGPTYIPTR